MRINSYDILRLLFLLVLLNGGIINAQYITLPQPPIPSISMPALPYANHPIYNEQNQKHYNEPINAYAESNHQNRQIIEESIKWHQQQVAIKNMAIKGFPSFEGVAGTELFYSAYDSISQMLSGQIPISVEKAVFWVENAFMGNKLSYNEFSDSIQSWINAFEHNCKKKNGNNVYNAGILFSTLTSETFQNGKIKSPIEYNLDDPESKNDYTSHFVSTLLFTNKGQCASMPLLYLILAERLGIEAFLSFAPLHSFVRVKGNRNWYNLELTCACICTDAFYIKENIKSEQIYSGLYLSELAPKEVVAHFAAQLGKYYLVKFGYDNFIIKCCELSKQHMSVAIDALKLQADYETKLTLELARLTNSRTPQQLKRRSPHSYIRYLNMMKYYREIDSIGYEEVRPEVYQRYVEYRERLKLERLGRIIEIKD